MTTSNNECLLRGRYKEQECIGRGNYGSAHLALDTVTQTRVVVKKIPIELMNESEKRQANGEVDVLSTLSHPYIVAYQTSYLEKEVLHIVMTYCEGGDLSQAIRNRKEASDPPKLFEESLILRWFVQMASAIRYIHGKKILHRDLKASNIFLTTDHDVQLGDFGIARVLEGTLEQAKTVVGTPYYMSPEVCESKPYSYSSDIWALGCILYEMCALKHAFSAPNLLGLVFKIVQHNYAPLPETFSSGLRGLVQRLLRKNPEERPSIEELFDIPLIRNQAKLLFIDQKKKAPRRRSVYDTLIDDEKELTRLMEAQNQHSNISSSTTTVEEELEESPVIINEEQLLEEEFTDDDDAFSTASHSEVEEHCYSEDSDEFESECGDGEVLEYSCAGGQSLEMIPPPPPTLETTTVTPPPIPPSSATVLPPAPPAVVVTATDAKLQALAAAKEYLQAQLGHESFEAVYEFLKRSRSEGRTKCKTDLIRIVGRSKLPLCVEVDALIQCEAATITTAAVNNK